MSTNDVETHSPTPSVAKQGHSNPLSLSWARRIRSTVLDASTFGFLLAVVFHLVLKPQADSYRNMQWLLTLTVALAFSGSILSLALARFRVATLGHIVFAPPYASSEPRPFFKTFWGWQTFTAFIVALGTGLSVTEFSFYELFSEEGFAGAARIFSALTNPEFTLMPIALSAIFETIFIAFTATSLAVPIAFVLAFLCARNLMGKHSVTFAVYGVLRTFLNVTRSIEPLIWAIIFSVWVGIGPFAGMLALLLHSVVSLTKQYSEMIESVSEGPIEGILATGASPIQVIWFAIVPQVVLPYVSFTIYRWDINVRMATVIGLVGGGGIGTMLIQYQGQAMWREVGCLVLVIAAVVWLMDTASAYLREALK